MPDFLERIRNIPHRKKAVIMGCGIVILLVVTFLLSQPNLSGQKGQLPNPAQTTPIVEDYLTNPLINPRDLNQVQDNYRKSLEKAGKVAPENTQSKFNYELAPELSNKQLQIPVKSALAASTCNIDNAPDNVTIYGVKAHWNSGEAAEVAKTYGITGSPASIPADGGGFQYFFSNPFTTGYLSLYETSGFYTYHRVLQPVSGSIGMDEAKQKADSEVAKATFDDGVAKKLFDSQYNATIDSYVFSYRKDWGDFIVVDENSIKNLGQQSVCDVSVASPVNTIEVVIARDNQLSRIVNQTRKSIKSQTAKRQSLTDSLAEYGTKPPIPPIVVGGSAATGTVTIDETTLVWYDLGPSYAQVAYIPAYLTSGHITGSPGIRVFTLLPAISLKDIKNSDVIAPDAYSLQLGTFNPKPPPPSLLTGCPGNTVDYTVSCSANGAQICSVFLGIKPEDDPNNICEDGCKSNEGTVTTQNNEDPCKIFLEQNHIPTDNYNPNPGGNPGGVYGGGTYSCVLNGCPC